MTMDAVLNEVLVGNREVAILMAAVVHVFNFDSSKHHVGRSAQHPERWRLEHRKQVRYELLADGVSTLAHFGLPKSLSHPSSVWIATTSASALAV
jgi:hypothetical protein